MPGLPKGRFFKTSLDYENLEISNINLIILIIFTFQLDVDIMAGICRNEPGGIQSVTCHFAKEFAHANPKRKTFFYEQTYQSPKRGGDPNSIGHGCDVEFVFGNYLGSAKHVPLDETFSQQMMTMWTDFAKTGYEFHKIQVIVLRLDKKYFLT